MFYNIEKQTEEGETTHLSGNTLRFIHGLVSHSHLVQHN